MGATLVEKTEAKQPSHDRLQEAKRSLLTVVFSKARHSQEFGVWRVCWDLTLALHYFGPGAGILPACSMLMLRGRIGSVPT